MRVADLIGLSLGALRQQKARMVMTTLGVVFGAFVLVVSLSLGEGVQETIERESHRDTNLRRIDVWPRWREAGKHVAAEQVQVKGEMSEEKRQRIRQALVNQRLRYSARGPAVPLDRERLRALAGLEHVTAVVPLHQQSGWAFLDGQSHPVQTCSAAPDNAFYSRRIVAGEFFHDAGERSVVLSEFFCYQFGLTSDTDVASVIGKKLRLEFRTEPRRTGLGVHLMKGDGEAPSLAEQVALDKIQSQLPAALDRLDLTPADRTALRAALEARPEPSWVLCAAEYAIVGVERQPTEDEEKSAWDRLNSDGDVLLPVGTAEELFFTCHGGSAWGADYARLVVDHEENVRGVAKQVSDMGMESRAPIEFIDRERLIYLLIFGTMACVAGVALLIAALGIANTMLMSVLERTREIGIFKAVGAGDGHVQLIFLIEGALIGVVGGMLGLLLAWAFSFPADHWVRSMISRDLKIDLKESLFVFPPWLTVGVVLFAVVVTTLAAVYPARRAARVEPLQALRHE
jgi:putative ABC transport system permease protein